MNPAQLSPELVLVAPRNDAEAVRAALPDRPWETLCGSWITLADPPPVPRLPAAAPSSSAPPALAPPAHTILLAALGAALAEARALQEENVTDGQPPSNGRAPLRQPEPEPAGAPAHGASTPAATTRGALLAKIVTAVVVVVAALAAVTWASDRTPVPSLEAGPSGRAPVANGGYVFDGGRLLVSSDGHSIASLELTTLCNQPVALPPLPLDVGSTFSFTGPIVGAGGTATLAGRFLDARQASFRLTLRVRGCPTTPVTRVGHLS